MSIYWVLFLLALGFIRFQLESSTPDPDEKDESSAKKEFQPIVLQLSLPIFSTVDLSKEVFDKHLAELRKCLFRDKCTSMEHVEKLVLFMKLNPGVLPQNAYENIFCNTPKNEFKQEQFHCQSISPVYVPDVKRKLPSYECVSGGKKLVLTSERFYEDRRSSFNVNVDRDTLRELYKPIRSIKNQVRTTSSEITLSHAQDSYDLYYSRNCFCTNKL